ncbi:Glycosyltransferase [Leptospira biflexa serovar Patoc strain 'Patoc 1 (Ames)']|jgi:dolichol-phosphate mannosyltransferase|uniref:Putative glycosyltransferase n=1 Tax=Leptospira biflexa serovar Patoc (strain Patoc 1 / ATCC 23582 / Paris) TaxID=456481 RepID=B0SSK3_LEPBP|nr:glycosyltransferase family 2 protein [Leptospira biflexa]ABZ94441.1 Glycosyltransferase [Leptospira biflexa serovar Patoc strain 'Patoc 1 (Ames)']ABZ98093.1 Putative glycosyltransferase [Leptospira biflexa serovar Patoc strain 'Patoc 1 (Paris)']TGM45222.1 glycosyltransferase [Leptospira biflexa]TGM54019.1 glycosyltransferase [Leptospira biflexa]
MKYYLEKRNFPKLLSIIIPCYNEESVLPILRERLDSFLPKLPSKVELILVNDGSSDHTIFELVDWANKDSRVKIVSLSRNFGHQIAVTAGMDYAKGDAVVIMDADLQDPPEVILEMLNRFQDGYDVVYGQRLTRSGESWFKKITAWIFYRLMKVLVHKDLPLDSGDFRLISRRCLDALNGLRENHRFLRGMNAWIGFPQIPVYYKRDPRVAGETKYPLQKMLKLAMNAAVSFSPLPLRFSLGLGIFVAFIGFAVGMYALYRAFQHFILHMPIVYNPGWATIVTLICLIGGSILISIGILGEYVARIFEESKGRPLYVVEFVKSQQKQKR